MAVATAAMSGLPASRSFQVVTVHERPNLDMYSVLSVRGSAVPSAVVVACRRDLEESTV